VVRKELNHTYGIAASYTNIGQLYTFSGAQNLDSAAFYIDLSIPLKLKINDRYGLARSYHNAAEIRLDQGKLDSALVYFKKALSLQLELDNSEGYASTYYNLASVYLKKDNYKMQLAYLDSSQLVAEEHKDHKLLWKVYSEKARTLGRLKRFDEAHPYWLAYTDIKDSLLSIDRSAKVEELETKFRTAEQEKEIADKKAALAETRLKVENRNKWLLGLSSGLLIILVLAFGIIQRNRRKSQAEKDAAIIAEREKGLKAIIEATEDERKRIAKDLHDGIVQTLTGLSLKLQKQLSGLSLSKDEQQDFKRSQEMLDESIAEVRTISHQMMPRVLSEMGLAPAIEDMLSKSLGNSGIQFEFEQHRLDKERFAENIEVSIYRICQELINNIIKHTGAKAVSVQLLKTKTHLVLVVEDNGKGFKFDDELNRNGIGLMNISSRASAINGEVNYQPSPEQGTVATIRIPLK
jgi:signal transduction histidine kinase